MNRGRNGWQVDRAIGRDTPDRAETRGDLRHGSLGHFDARTIQILLKTAVELRQAAILEICHALLLVLRIPPRSDLVRSRHLVR